MKNRLNVMAVCIVTLVLTAAGGHEEEKSPQQFEGQFGYIGTVDLPITCINESTQLKFNYALAQYCHMSYETARYTFASLLGDEPNCAMAYWGVAMTHVAPVWPMTPTEANLVPGAQAVAHARRLANGLSEREKLYIEAAGALYDDWKTVPYPKRLERWLSAQEKLYRAYPDDDEAAAFYALALVAVGDSHADSNFENHRQAGTILEEVFGRKPEHPGAIHYSIHAYDKPPLALKAVPMARAYGKVAPNIAHANHMPTHIYTRLGYWGDSKMWNERARTAAKEIVLEGRVYAEYLHATDYLVYANLQTGHDGAAESILSNVSQDGPHMQNFVAAYALAAIPARLALERRDWTRAASLEVGWDGEDPDFDWTSQDPSVAVTHFARGIGAARGGQLELAAEELDTLREIHDRVIRSHRPFWRKRVEIQMRAVEACIEYAEGQHESSLSRLRTVANREDEVGKHPVMPAVVLPIRELFADLSMERGNYEAALLAYEMNLESRPGRFNSIGGAGRASELLGKKEQAQSYYEQLLDVADGGDTDRKDIQFAHAFLAD